MNHRLNTHAPERNAEIDLALAVMFLSHAGPAAIEQRALTKLRRRLGRVRMEAAFTLVEIMIAIVAIGLMAAMAIPAFQKTKERQNPVVNTDPEFPTYVAWVKMTRYYQITFDEWKRLKEAGLLAPQPR